MKTHFDHTVHPLSFVEGDLVLLYDQANDKLGAGKFEPMWHGPYIVKWVLQYKACATWAQIFLPPAYHSLDRRVGLNIPQQKNKDGQYDRSEFSLSSSMLQ